MRHRHHIASALPLALGILLSPTAAQAEERFLIAIGNNLGFPNDAPLRWAEKDAERFATTMGELAGISSDRVIRLLNTDVDQIRLAFARVRGQVQEASRAGKRTALFVFYSGHADPQALHIRGRGLKLRALKAMIKKVASQVSVSIVDACHSGSLIRGRSKGLKKHPAFDISYARDIGPEGHVFISSAGADEVAQESDELKSSFFTHHLLSALRGAGDADRDGRVTLSETYRYVYHRTLTTSHGTKAAVQHPELDTDLAGEGELVLATLDRAQARLTILEDISGSVLIVDDRNSQVFTELTKPADRTTSIALPAGRYRVQVRRGDAFYASEFSLPWGGTHRLRARDLSEQPLYAALAKGTELDAQNWTLTLGAGAGPPLVDLDATAWRGQLAVIRSMPGWVDTRLTLGVANSSATNARFRFHTREAELGVGAGARTELGGLTIGAWLGGGILLAHQTTRRLDADRVALVFRPQDSERHWTLGGMATLDAEFRVPLVSDWTVAVQPGIRVVTFSNAGEIAVNLRYVALLSVGYEF